MNNILKVDNLSKSFKDFKLENISFELPKGYTVALVGSNGAGKTTLLDLIMEFIKRDSGIISYFEEVDSIEEKDTKNRIGYVEDNNYFIGDWGVKQVEEVMSVGFDNFNKNTFYNLVERLNIPKNKNVNKMSKGTKMLLMLAAQFSRDTELLLLDEPASPLDPVMREELCDLFREYIKDGEKTVFFSTHNIADMEYATDYVIVMKNGHVIGRGFVEDLKEKYVVVRGDSKDVRNIENYIMDLRVNSVGFEGMSAVENIDKIKEVQEVIYETPSLQQIVIMLLKGEDKHV